MDLKAKIDELRTEHARLEAQKEAIHKNMIAIRKKIQKYETVLKHANEIEPIEETPHYE